MQQMKENREVWFYYGVVQHVGGPVTLVRLSPASLGRNKKSFLVLLLTTNLITAN